MKRCILGVLWLMVMCFIMSACATSDAVPSTDDVAENVNRMKGGDASGESKTNKITPTVAGSNMGDAKAENTVVEGATLQRTNSTAGHLVTGVNLAASGGGIEKALATIATSSPTMKALTTQLEYLMAQDPVDNDAVSDVIDKMRAEEKTLREMLANTGTDLSSLTHFTQVVTLISANGADNPVSDEQAKALSENIAPTVSAAKGKSSATPATSSEPADPSQPISGDGQ